MFQLKIEHLSKSYGRQSAVKDLSFVVEPGRVTGFLGPNGAGRSTSLKILLGLAEADEGRALIGDRRYSDLSRPAATVGVILEHAYHPGRSGRDHLRNLADYAGISSSRVEAMLELVGLSRAAERAAGTYSLGMRQRLGLAGALLGHPPVLVLDEPGNGLDPQGIQRTEGLLRDRAAEGGSVLITGHLLSEMEHLADEIRSRRDHLRHRRSRYRRP